MSDENARLLEAVADAISKELDVRSGGDYNFDRENEIGIAEAAIRVMQAHITAPSPETERLRAALQAIVDDPYTDDTGLQDMAKATLAGNEQSRQEGK